MNPIKSFLFILALACTMTSCFDNTGYQSSPYMEFGYAYVNPQFVGDTTFIGGEDTLFSHYNEALEQWCLDTLHLGDTMMFPAYFTSFTNNLVSVVASFDTTRVNLWFDLKSNDQLVINSIAAGSQVEKGILIFSPMYNEATFPIYVVPQEAGTYPIKITVTSDSQFPNNASLFTLPVK